MENINNSNIADCKFKDEVCINVQRIYDTCKDKDCFADLRVYLNPQDQKSNRQRNQCKNPQVRADLGVC